MLLVDVRPWMHEPTAEADAAGGGDGGGEASTPFRNALRIALKLMKQRIIVADNDLIGLMFYGAVRSCISFPKSCSVANEEVATAADESQEPERLRGCSRAHEP